jgi:GTP:adenosylcobinamide-phosphate guanylyltransferase
LTGFRALVLAGSRGGADPVAAYAGVSHKALIMLGGETLLARVVAALRAAGAERVAVISSHPEVRIEMARLGVEARGKRGGEREGKRQRQQGDTGSLREGGTTSHRGELLR